MGAIATSVRSFTGKAAGACFEVAASLRRSAVEYLRSRGHAELAEGDWRIRTLALVLRDGEFRGSQLAIAAARSGSSHAHALDEFVQRGVLTRTEQPKRPDGGREVLYALAEQSVVMDPSGGNQPVRLDKALEGYYLASGAAFVRLEDYDAKSALSTTVRNHSKLAAARRNFRPTRWECVHIETSRLGDVATFVPEGGGKGKRVLTKDAYREFARLRREV